VSSRPRSLQAHMLVVCAAVQVSELAKHALLQLVRGWRGVVFQVFCGTVQNVCMVCHWRPLAVSVSEHVCVVSAYLSCVFGRGGCTTVCQLHIWHVLPCQHTCQPQAGARGAVCRCSCGVWGPVAVLSVGLVYDICLALNLLWTCACWSHALICCCHRTTTTMGGMRICSRRTARFTVRALDWKVDC
jgi:hypothetical protein